MNIGLRYPVCAPYSIGVDNKPAYTGGFVMGKGVSINPGTETRDTSFYADDELYMSDTGISGGTISEEISHMLPAHYAQLLGHAHTEAGDDAAEKVVIADGDEPIEVGHGYIVVQKYKDNAGNPVTKYVVVWYKRVKFSEPNENESKTEGENREYSAITIEGKWSKACDGTYGEKHYCDTEAAAKAILNTLADIKPAAAAN